MKPRVVIIGGGSGGISVASRLLRAFKYPDIWVIEPQDTHYYQPFWTLVGGGIVSKEASCKSQAEVMPRGVTWIRDQVTELHASEKTLDLKNGDRISFDYLVIAAGIQIDWDSIPGLTETLGQNGVCSIYDYKQSEITWKTINNFKGGTALFNGAATPIKCGGAPQKIMYLAEEALRKNGVRDQSKVIFQHPGKILFGVKEYCDALQKVVDQREIQINYQHTLTHIEPMTRIATFKRVLENGETETFEEKYDLLHVIPHMSCPDFLKRSDVIAQEGPLAGWVEADMHTLQHPRFPYIFSLGDAAGLPDHPKTGAAVRKQAPVLVKNLIAQMLNEPLTGSYDGYSSCPLVTSKNTVILAEFIYNNKMKSSYPSFINSATERRDAMLLKRYGLPYLYWHGMLKGLL